MTRTGSQEPTKSKIIPFSKTEADKAIELYQKSNRVAYDWQIGVLQPMMAINEDNLWTHAIFGYAVPRQNGKNEIIAMRELGGLFAGERILHTAHRTNTSKSAFERLVSILEEMGYVNQEDFMTIKALGNESITFKETNGRINFRTRTATGGLGESYDLLVIDEAQEYTEEQESTLKYTIAASPNPQTIMLGTPPTPVSSGTVFTGLRKKALVDDAEDIGWAEWSIPEKSDVRDIELWYLTNPSLGLRLNERTIRTEVGDDDVDFNIQRLGLWLQYNQKSEISSNEWLALKVNKLPKLQGKLFVGIKYGHDGQNVAMSIAVKTNNGHVFVETIDCRPVREGNAWILSFLKVADVQQVIIDGANGQNLLASEMKDIKLKAPKLPTVKEVINANAQFEQSLYGQTLMHKGQPSLTQVTTNVSKRNIGSNGGWGYTSQLADYDIALLESIVLANWACVNAKPVRKQRVSY